LTNNIVLKRIDMTKKLLLGSLVAAALVFTGCGDDDDTTTPDGGNSGSADTVKPVVKTTATAPVDSAIILATDNVAVTEITLSGTGAQAFTVDGTTVTTPATAGSYMVTVTAKDAAGNEGTGDVNVTVTSSSTPAPTNTIISSGLEWTKLTVDDDDSETDGRRLRADALAQCPAGTGFPTVAQLEANLTDLATKFNIATINGGNDVPVFTTDAANDFVIEVTPNASGVIEGYTQANDGSSASFFTCVKAAQ
jgi:hypothetical protein